jgi:hypothetical protein
VDDARSSLYRCRFVARRRRRGADPGVCATLDAGTGHGRVANALKNDGTVGLDIRATTGMGDITARSL